MQMKHMVLSPKGVKGVYFQHCVRMLVCFRGRGSVSVRYFFHGAVGVVLFMHTYLGDLVHSFYTSFEFLVVCLFLHCFAVW